MAFESLPQLECTIDSNLETFSRQCIWYADSAASSHMTSHCDWFASYSSFPENYWPIQGIAPQPLYAAGIGTISIERLINGRWQPGYIEGVLHVPEIESNLFSITKAARKGILTTFSSHGCTMTSGGTIVLQGTLQNNLYELQLRVVAPPSDNGLVAASFRPATIAEARESLKVWHARLCHINPASIKLLVRQELAEGIELLHDNTSDSFCEGCCYGKQHRTSFPVNSVRTYAANPGDLLHADIMEMDTESIGGALYCLIVKDDATGYRIAFSLKRKSDALPALQQACRQVQRDTGHQVRVLRTDRGGEFVSKQAKKFFDEHLIRQELTAPHTPEQNGAAERENRTIMELVRSMLHSRNVPAKFWAEAVQTAVYVLNRTTSTSRSHTTPYEAWWGLKPSLNHLRIFGCSAFIHAEKHTRTKLKPKSRPGMFLGYSEESKAYRIWDLTKQKVVITRDIICNEQDPLLFPPQAIPQNPTPVTVVFKTRSSPLLSQPAAIPLDSPSIPTASQVSLPLQVPSSVPVQLPPIPNTVDSPTQEDDPLDRLDLIEKPDGPSRSSRQSKPPNRYGDWAYLTQLAAANDTSLEPGSLIEALSSPEADRWIQAMQEEYTSLLQNATWEITDLPLDRKPVSCKWNTRSNTILKATLTDTKLDLLLVASRSVME